MDDKIGQLRFNGEASLSRTEPEQIAVEEKVMAPVGHGPARSERTRRHLLVAMLNSAPDEHAPSGAFTFYFPRIRSYR